MARTDVGAAARSAFAAGCFVFVSALSAPLLAAAADVRPAETVDAETLLRAALDAPKRISYVGQLQTIRWGTQVANATLQRIEHLAPASTRRTYLAPEALYGEYDVTVGTTTIKVDPRDHRFLITENPSLDSPIFTQANIALLVSNYRAVVGPVEVVAARPATTLSLVNKHTGERTMKLWIDNATKIVLAKEAYYRDGSVAWRMRYDDIRFTGEIPSGIFSSSAPSGFQEVTGRRYAEISGDVERTEEAAGFRPVWPHALPEGFSIVGSSISLLDGVRNLHLIYSDGIRSLSLFENNEDAPANFGGLHPTATSFAGHQANYVKDGPTTLLAWRDNGVALALVGDLDVRELTAIASSVSVP